MQPNEIIDKILLGEDLSTTVANALASNTNMSRRRFLGLGAQAAEAAARHAIGSKLDKVKDIATLASGDTGALSGRLAGILKTGATNIAKDQGKSRIGGFLARFAK